MVTNIEAGLEHRNNATALFLRGFGERAQQREKKKGTPIEYTIRRTSQFNCPFQKTASSDLTPHTIGYPLTLTSSCVAAGLIFFWLCASLQGAR